MEIVTSWERKGKQEAILEVARNLLKEGMEVPFVARTTGLTEQEVKKLIQEME